MNGLDFAIIHFLNGFAHRCWTFDAFVMVVEESNLLKGGIGLALFWWAWVRYHEASDKQELLLFAFVSSSFSLLFARALALCIPFRERPLRNPQYGFQIPYTVTGSVHSWNSAPSDHAVLFFCLATALFMVSRRLGILALFHAIFLVCLPRIYVGYHYPTDLLAGAVIGIGGAFTCKLGWLRTRIVQPAFRWKSEHPASFYAIAFLWTFEVAELFASLLNFQAFARHGLQAFVHLHQFRL